MNERQSQSKVDPQQILASHAQNAGVSLEVFLGKSRKRELVRERVPSQIEMHRGGMSIGEIGKKTKRHHSTVSYHIRRSLSAEKKPEINLPALAQSYINANFPGISLDQIRAKDTHKLTNASRNSLEHYLFHDAGVGLREIAIFLYRNVSTIRRTLNKSSDKIEMGAKSWHEKRKVEEKKKREEIFANNTLRIVAADYGTNLKKLHSKSLEKTIVQARKTAQFIIRKGTEYSYQKISYLLGRKNHTTSRSAVLTVERRMVYDEEFRERVEELFEEISWLTDEEMEKLKSGKQNPADLDFK